MKNPVAILSKEVLYNKLINDENVILLGTIDLFRNFDTNKCYPSRETIGSLLLIKARQITNGINALEEQGILEVERVIGKSNSYRIITSKVFGTIEKEILLDTELKAGAKRTYAKLSESSNNETKIYKYSKFSKLAEKFQLGRKALREYLTTLNAKGYINWSNDEQTIELIGTEKKSFIVIKEETKQIKSIKQNASIRFNVIKANMKKIANELCNLKGQEFEAAKNEIKQLKNKLEAINNSNETKVFLNDIKNIIIKANKQNNTVITIEFTDNDFEDLYFEEIKSTEKKSYGFIRGNSEVDKVLKAQDKLFNKKEKQEYYIQS